MKKLKIKKVKCEVCGASDRCTLHSHHIIPRVDSMCTNDRFNIAILCSNCHNKVHAGVLKIIGVYPSTDPSGVTLIYELGGEKNIDGIDDPYLTPKSKSMKVHYGREISKAVRNEQETDSSGQEVKNI